MVLPQATLTSNIVLALVSLRGVHDIVTELRAPRPAHRQHLETRYQKVVMIRPNELGTDRGHSDHNLFSWLAIEAFWTGRSSLDIVRPQATLTSSIVLALVSLCVA